MHLVMEIGQNGLTNVPFCRKNPEKSGLTVMGKPDLTQPKKKKMTSFLKQ